MCFENKLIAWNIVYEIMQRSKEPLLLVTLYPGGGQYKCLAILRSFDENPLMLINLHGISIKGNNDDLISPYPELYNKNKEELLCRISHNYRFDLAERPVRHLQALEFFIYLTTKGIDVISAWIDSSNDSCLGDEAKAFPYYPDKDVHDAQVHWPWWIIRQSGQAIAMCNIDTGELILRSGDRYNVKKNKRVVVMCNITYLTKLNDWKNAIADTQALLKANDEWRDRYAEYARLITTNLPTIESARKTFHEWEPLKLYLNVSNAKNAKKAVRFDLRYLGQTVAELIYTISPKLSTTKYIATNKRDFGCTLTLSDVEWNSPEAREFRNFFKKMVTSDQVNNPGNEEHRYESLILTEMSKAKNKALPYMKPVTIGGLRFPMPTPLRASDHKSVSYANFYGGGIDAFARAGTGGTNTNLCIMELKDENKPTEPPKDAIKQALVYTTFIRELLRSDSGDKWWSLFGFGGKIPDKLLLFAVCVMPSNNNDDTSFEGQDLPIGGDDIARLHYIYFTELNNKITGVNSSL